MKKLRSLTASTTFAALAGVVLISSVAVAAIPEAKESKSTSGFTKKQLKTVKKLVAKQQGPTGAAGARGAQGLNGAKGDKGDTGARGPSTVRFRTFPSSSLSAAAGVNTPDLTQQVLVPLGSTHWALLNVNATVTSSTAPGRSLNCEVAEDGITSVTASGSITGTGQIAINKPFVLTATSDPLFPTDGKVQVDVICNGSGNTGSISIPTRASSISLIQVDSQE
jgi:hypothetical protein